MSCGITCFTGEHVLLDKMFYWIKYLTVGHLSLEICLTGGLFHKLFTHTFIYLSFYRLCSVWEGMSFCKIYLIYIFINYMVYAT